MRTAFVLLLVVFGLHAVGQTPAYSAPSWVFFADKTGVEFNPADYFDEHALARKARHQRPLYDAYDLPVRTDYLDQLAQWCDSIDGVSRWLNAAVVYASDDQLAHIRSLPFVTAVEQTREVQAAGNDTTEFKEFYDLVRLQTERLAASTFRTSGFTGKGVRVAVFDVGFPNVDVHPAFAHIRERNGIVKTYDFSRKSENVYRGIGHGTAVLSCIAGLYDSIPMGLATGADFLLARTERLITEWTAEEHRWVFAAEWADKNGADIISSSLGYTAQRYFRQDMDGRTAPITRAANIAASKGILVVNAAGNDGDNSWRTVGAPADGDSVLTVGGTNPYTDITIDFSSRGPTSDFRMKPNVCAFGEAVTAARKGIHVSFGTSFACPLVAGFAACALQSRPELDGMQLFKAIEQSGHLYPYFDYVHGYGIPQADKFLGTREVADTTFHFDRMDGSLQITLTDTVFPVGLKELYDERIGAYYSGLPDFRLPQGTHQKNLYYHVKDNRGLLVRYGVILPYEQVPLTLFDWIDFSPGETVTVHYEGFTDSITIE